MNTDIRLSVGFFRNIKVRKLRKVLGAEGVLSLQALWLFCAENVPDGNLGKYSEDIEFIVEWGGEEGAFVSTLLTLGFLDEKSDGTFLVHDWSENNPYVATSEARADVGRLSRLKRENPEAAQRFEAEGRKGITSAEYQAVKYQRSIEVDKADVISGTEGTYNIPMKVPSKVPTTNLEGILQGSVYSSTSTSSSTNTSPNTGTERKDFKGVMSTKPAPTLPPDGGAPPMESFDLSPEIKIRTPSDNCPHERIVELYHEILPGLPHVKVWKGADESNLRARWREDKARQNLDWWRGFFEYVARSDFLTGRTAGRDGKPFFASLGWIVKASNFSKILNGNYNHEAPNAIEQVKRMGYDEAKRQLELKLRGGQAGTFGPLRDVIDIDGEVQST